VAIKRKSLAAPDDARQVNWRLVVALGLNTIAWVLVLLLVFWLTRPQG